MTGGPRTRNWRGSVGTRPTTRRSPSNHGRTSWTYQPCVPSSRT
ncbi:hypothetical protein [Ornithinimicrobium kibberense]